jgi:glycosyltransferase 2 family protein
VLLLVLARRIDWAGVAEGLRALPRRTLAEAAAAALAAHFVYTWFDVLARRYSRHDLPITTVLPITFVCYTFNLNLGSWLGSFGLRYRLYSRRGLSPIAIARIVTFSLLTNWVAYLALGGSVFLATGRWRLLGVAMLVLALAYLGICVFSRRRSFQVRGRTVELPSAPLAFAQLVLGACNWGCMALVVYLLLGRRIDYPAVLATLLVSAVAGVISHIPAGLGVLEAVFLSMLGERVPHATLLAALIGYRVVYFLGPLALASVVLLVLESRVTSPMPHDL